ncbi:hypothetical protein KJS94_08400 [Flavihumibacter rivuli]|uniref:hypothetical protein n=1 Tax=Flavihumibacter rivuli TaxID=2838156 RepID=UPI001BDF21B1|nr:hypothetical protein [Flavihumibacter rivuli]ULQ58215.1 hypothetical protein KJS94_08400 [Flavihumibacter rivuli]
MLKKDNLRLGIALGILAPVIGMLLYYLLEFYSRNVGLAEFLGYLKTYKSLLTAVSSISLVANAVLFTIYINSRKDKTAKGVFIATLIYGITVLLIKLIG